MSSNFDVDEKSFDIIDLPLSAVLIHRHNKPEKVAVPPLASNHLSVRYVSASAALTIAGKGI